MANSNPNPATRFKEGESGNPNGRPKGQRNYATIQAEAIISLGKKKNKTPEQIENELLENGIARAFNGDYRYYKDVLDRTHGTAQVNSKSLIEHSGEIDSNMNVNKQDIEAIALKVAEELKNTKVDANPNKTTTSRS